MNRNSKVSSAVRGFACAALLTLFCAPPAFGQAPVQVTNGIREPVPVRDVSAQQAIVFSVDFVGGNGPWSPVVYHVPSRKRLVIEYFSFDATSVASSAIARLRTQFKGVLQTGIYGHTARINGRLVGSHAVKVYADAGTSVAVGLDTEGGLPPGRISFTGYLVDMPLQFEVAQ